MVEAMEVDDGVKHETTVNGAPENSDAVDAESIAIPADKVTLLQASVDKMALSMFNALRLLPATLGDDKTREENVAAIKQLAKDVLVTVKETDALIDELPGLNRTEEEQMEEFRRLQLQSEEEAQTLRQVAEEAEKLKIADAMTDRFGGRVLAGEDSEEDEEEEEALGFQFGASRSPAPPTVASMQPKFNIQAAVIGAEDDESDEDEEDAVPGVSGPPSNTADTDAPSAEPTSTPERTPRVSIDSSARSISRPTTPELPSNLVSDKSAAAYEAEWVADGSVDGVAMMGHSVMEKLQPGLDGTIRRIAELTESQQRLLSLLQDQHREICRNDQLENIAIVMGKLPQYIKKVQDIKAAMTEISTSVDRMKKRSETLRVDAQSHAIKKENKRESLNQWNKLYAAKSYDGATMSATDTISSALSYAPARQPPPM